MTTNGSDLEFFMLDLINEERAANGQSALKLEQNLNQSAEDHSLWMLRADIFSHTGVSGSSSGDRMRNADFTFSGSWASGENVAYQSVRGAAGFIDDVENLHDALMNSSGHRANILSGNFEYVGIGVEYGTFNGYNVIMITQNFAKTSAQVTLDNGQVAPAAVPDFEVINGTSGRDVLNGTSGDDFISGGDGKDVLRGGGGDDTIRGGDGKDWLSGGSGADVFLGGKGADVFLGGKGADVVSYSDHSSGVTADLGNQNATAAGTDGDTYSSISGLRGTSQADALRGNGGDNYLHGRQGDDVLKGRDGDDKLIGGQGNDVLRGNDGNDVLCGGGGSDRFVFETGMDRDVVKDFQNDVDILNFQGMGYRSLNQVMATASERNNDVVFDLAGSDKVIVRDATLVQVVDDIWF